MEDLGTGQKKSIIANAHLERAVGVLHEHGWLWADQASTLLEEAKGNLATLESLPAFAEQFAETCRVLGTVVVHKNATHGNAELARCVQLSCVLCALSDITDLFRLIHDAPCLSFHHVYWLSLCLCLSLSVTKILCFITSFSCFVAQARIRAGPEKV